MKKYILITVLAVLGAIACKPTEPKGLLVMSFNVRNSGAADGENSWVNRRAAAAAMLNTLNPDVVGMQEVLPDQQEAIDADCPRYTAYGIGRDDGVNGERMTVMYNHDVIEYKDGGTWWLSETPDVPSLGWDAKCFRTATWVLLKDKRSGKDFYFVNTHLDHRGAEARRNGLAMVVAKIKEMNPDVPMVFMGDFNVEPGDPALDALDGLMLDARTTAKVTEDTPSFNGFDLERHKVIDYIYYSGFAGAESFRVVTEQYENAQFVSDHYPIISELVY